MEPTRAVRIPAARPSSEGAGTRGTAGADGAVHPSLNRSGCQRAIRTYALFLVALLAIYGIFLGTFLTAPESGVRSNPSEYGFFSLVLVVIGLYGFGVTVWRAPREVRATEQEVVVLGRTGRERRFSRGPGFVVSVLKRYPGGLFSDEATELVRVALPDGSARVYLVDEGLIPSTSPG
ncbi:MAG: hypothetical protein L3J95_02795 [Thermoplasmata archaeon]|nr:hypothetical protein [Thermoplasmata archaeon]MCI4359335.1 hypothetical protein [Thermoplasmata archaeon]